MKQVLAIGIGCVVLAITGDYALREYYNNKKPIEIVCSDEPYPYLFADNTDIQTGKDSFRLWIGSAGGISCDVSIWISPAEVNRDASNPLYWSLRKYKAGKRLLYKEPVMLGQDIDPGDYIVEMSTRAGTVIEHLEIKNISASTTPIIIQEIKLERNGKELVLPSDAMLLSSPIH